MDEIRLVFACCKYVSSTFLNTLDLFPFEVEILCFLNKLELGDVLAEVKGTEDNSSSGGKNKLMEVRCNLHV